jgi:hypothetical protein
MIDVVIATPGQFVNKEYVLSLVKTIQVLEQNNVSYAYVNSDSARISQARHLCLEIANQIEYKKIFWIDSDMSWEPKDFLKILNSQQEITSGVYLNKGGRVVATKTDNKTEILKEEVIDKQYLIEAGLIGFGFVCITKEVMDILDAPFIEYVVEVERGGIYHGGDESWCLRIQLEGKKIFLDTEVKVNHHKNIKIGW